MKTLALEFDIRDILHLQLLWNLTDKCWVGGQPSNRNVGNTVLKVVLIRLDME